MGMKENEQKVGGGESGASCARPRTRSSVTVGGDKTVASRARHRTSPSMGVGGGKTVASRSCPRTSPSMGVAAKKFAEKWKGRGYEKGETHSFWIEQKNRVMQYAQRGFYFVVITSS